MGNNNNLNNNNIYIQNEIENEEEFINGNENIVNGENDDVIDLVFILESGYKFDVKVEKKEKLMAVIEKIQRRRI